MKETLQVHCAYDDMVDLEAVVANPRNPNRHSGEQIRLLAKIIQYQGWRAPITVSRRSGFIVRGHARLLAARELHLDKVPVDWQEYASEAAEWADLIADNRIAELAEMERPALKDLLEELDTGALDMELTGWTENALEELMSEFHMDGPEEDDFDGEAEAEKIVEPVSKRGDVWLLGEHRLMCGDSTRREDVERLMDGQPIGAIIADPPYGMRLSADFSGMVNSLGLHKAKGLRHGKKYDNVIGDNVDFDASTVTSIIDAPAIQFWFGADYYSSSLPDTEHSGAWLVWDKRLDESADKMFGSCFELIWSKQKCKRDMIRVKWAGVFGIEKELEHRREHPNQKPIALLGKLVDRTEGIVYDPFAGSSSVLIAAEQTGRVCYAMEISERYVDVGVKRWEQYTGKRARLAAGVTD